MHWLDIVIVVAILLLAALGWRIGFLRNAVVLVAAIVGVVLAGAYHERVIVDLAISENPTAQMRFASFIAIVLVLLLLGGLAGAFLRGAASVLMLGWADRAAGLVFGALAALLIIQALIAIAVAAPLPGAPEELGQSEIGRRLMDNIPVVRALLPEAFDIALGEFLDGIGSARDTVGL